jgi:hypothetical protein
MLMCVCTLRDEVLSTFARPMFTRNVAEATRSFTIEANNAESEIFKHSSDYSIWELGTYDDDTASFSLLPQPRLICRASDVVSKS